MADPTRPTASHRAARSRILEGQPYPLGANWDGLGVNFALFSAHATKVELCLFDDAGEAEIERIDLPEYTDEIWHGYLPNVGPGAHASLQHASGKPRGMPPAWVWTQRATSA